MQLFKEKKALNDFINQHKKEGLSIGLVPTMGALHKGHLFLVEEAYKHCEVVVISIFINPTQFNNPSDLEKYPRTLEQDLSLLEKDYPDSVVFSPSVEEVYGNKITAKHFDFGPIANEMEGKYRAGHFDGVGTIVELLFDIVKPDKAFFGEKDYQQLLIIKKLVEITNKPIQVIGCDISRETSGLARSSRNGRLSEEQQKEAAFIYKTLKDAKKQFGTKNAQALIEDTYKIFKDNSTLKLEYFEISNADTLKPITEEGIEKNQKYRAFIAAYAGDVRLIDNIALNY